MQRVITAPLAIIRVGGRPVGKMRNIRLSETVRRAKVTGLGRLTPTELPALEWDGTMNCGFYLIDLSKTIFENNDQGKAMYRNVQTVEEFADTLLLQDEGIQIDIMRKAKDSQTNLGVISSKYEKFATIGGIYITRESMSIDEGQISGRDAEFQYTTPILYPA